MLPSGPFNPLWQPITSGGTYLLHRYLTPPKWFPARENWLHLLVICSSIWILFLVRKEREEIHKRKHVLLPHRSLIFRLNGWVPFWHHLQRSPQVSGGSHTPFTLQETTLHISPLSEEPPQSTTISHSTVVHIFHLQALPWMITLIEMAAEASGLRSSSVTCSEYSLLSGWCRSTGSQPTAEMFLSASNCSPSCPFLSISSTLTPQIQDQKNWQAGAGPWPFCLMSNLGTCQAEV